MYAKCKRIDLISRPEIYITTKDGSGCVIYKFSLESNKEFRTYTQFTTFANAEGLVNELGLNLPLGESNKVQMPAYQNDVYRNDIICSELFTFRHLERLALKLSKPGELISNPCAAIIRAIKIITSSLVCRTWIDYTDPKKTNIKALGKKCSEKDLFIDPKTKTSKGERIATIIDDAGISVPVVLASYYGDHLMGITLEKFELTENNTKKVFNKYMPILLKQEDLRLI